jgi:hypothetical protein
MNAYLITAVMMLPAASMISGCSSDEESGSETGASSSVDKLSKWSEGACHEFTGEWGVGAYPYAAVEQHVVNALANGPYELKIAY